MDQSLLKSCRVLPVVTATDVESTVQLTRTLHKGGMKAVEITLRTAAALDSIRAVKAAPHQTSLRMLRHKDKLYFAIRCEETHLEDPAFLQIDFDYPLAINKEPGGYLWWAESIELFLDPGRDRKRVFQTMLNPWGLKQCFTYDTVKYGYFNIENQVADADYPVIGKIQLLKDAWVIECSIPLSAFGPEGPDGEWGFNLARTRRLRVGDGMKYSSWTPLGWGFQDAGTFGILTFDTESAKGN